MGYRCRGKRFALFSIPACWLFLFLFFSNLAFPSQSNPSFTTGYLNWTDLDDKIFCLGLIIFSCLFWLCESLGDEYGWRQQASKRNKTKKKKKFNNDIVTNHSLSGSSVSVRSILPLGSEDCVLGEERVPDRDRQSEGNKQASKRGYFMQRRLFFTLYRFSLRIVVDCLSDSLAID
ncbi:hypothetical protein V8F33_000437 [Rhypophila sp. PSN 637]